MKNSSDRSLWLGVAGLFALMIGAWIALFTLAAKNPIQTVPLASAVAPEQR